MRHIDTFNKPGPVRGGQHNGFEHGGDRRRGLRSRGHGMEARLERRHKARRRRQRCFCRCGLEHRLWQVSVNTDGRGARARRIRRGNDADVREHGAPGIEADGMTGGRDGGQRIRRIVQRPARTIERGAVVHAALEDVINPGRARGARPQFEERPHAVRVGLLDGGMEPHQRACLRGEHRRAGVGRRFVGAMDGVGVQPRVLERARRAVMHGVPRVGERLEFGAVHQQVVMDGHGTGPQGLDHREALRLVAADDGVALVVLNQHAHPRMARDFGFERCDRMRDSVAAPRDGCVIGKAPRGAQGLIVPGQVAVVHARLPHIGKQVIGVGPRARGHDGVGFAARQAEAGLRHDAQPGEQQRVRLADEGGQLQLVNQRQCRLRQQRGQRRSQPRGHGPEVIPDGGQRPQQRAASTRVGSGRAGEHPAQLARGRLRGVLEGGHCGHVFGEALHARRLDAPSLQRHHPTGTHPGLPRIIGPQGMAAAQRRRRQLQQRLRMAGVGPWHHNPTCIVAIGDRRQRGQDIARPRFARAHDDPHHAGVGQRRIIAKGAATGIDRAHECGVDVATAQCVGCQAQGFRPRRTARTDDHPGTARIERAVEPVGRHVGHRAQHAGGLQRRDDGIAFGLADLATEILREPPAAAVAGSGRVDIRADEHADAVAIEIVQLRAQRLRCPQQQHLLRQCLLQVGRGKAESLQFEVDGTGPAGGGIEAEQHAEDRRGRVCRADRQFTRDQRKRRRRRRRGCHRRPRCRT